MGILLVSGLEIDTQHVPLARETVSWFPSLPMGDKVFDKGPIRPRDIRSVLSRKKASESSGGDGILNGHLKNFLATLFTKTLHLSKPVGWLELVFHYPYT